MKTLRLKAIILSTLLTTCQLWAAGGESGGGGSAVKCKDGKMYSLDYLLTQRPANEEQFPREITNAKDEKEILLAIAENLKKKIPNLGLALENYTKSLYSQSNPDQLRYWSPSEHQLISTDDQIIIKNLTEKCGPKINPETKDIALEQAVIRSPMSGFKIDTGVNSKGETIEIRSVQYTFDYSVLNLLRKNSPIQVSFLLLHEFFRDFTDDVKVMYRLSRFMHHSFHLSDVEIFNSMVALGLSNEYMIQARFFELKRHALYQEWVSYRHSLEEIKNKFRHFAFSEALVLLQDLTKMTFELQKNFDLAKAAALKGSIIGLSSFYNEKKQEALSAFEIILKKRPNDLPGIFAFYENGKRTQSEYLSMHKEISDPQFIVSGYVKYLDHFMGTDNRSNRISEISSHSLDSGECYRIGLLEPTFCNASSLLFTINELEKENAPKPVPDKKSSYFPWSR